MGSVTYISYCDAITEQRIRQLMAACGAAIAETKPSQLYFLFASSGGSVDAGIALYNLLRGLPVPIVMHNVGNIDSVANVVFLAADERYAAPHSNFHLHGITWGFSQPVQLTWNQLQEIVSNFKADETRLRGVIKERTSLTDEELTVFFHQGETKTLEFAKQKGIIRDIRPVKVPQGAPFFPLNFT